MSGAREKATFDAASETKWSELNRTQRTAAIRRLGKLSHREIGRRLGVSAQSIQVHVSKYGAQQQPRRASVHNDQRETLTPYKAKSASFTAIRKAFLRETRPDGTPYMMEDVRLALGPDRRLTPPRTTRFNRFQNEQLHALTFGSPLV